ncbi:MAG: glycine/sarcosine/betaine reductase component B subunit [Bacillota bacterium]
MQLELAKFPVHNIEFGEKTEYINGLLRVNKKEILGVIGEDHRIEDLDLHITNPGDSVRIIHVLDMVEPRFKPEGGIFPGFLSPPHTAGSGRTNCLEGAAVILTGEYSKTEKGLMVSREGVIDMGGPAAQYCLGAKTHNLVLTSKAAAGVSNAEYDAGIRLASLKVAACLAETTKELSAENIETYELNDTAEGLPRVAYIYQIQSQGALLETFVYGSDAVHLVPTLMHPNEFMDGAVVSGNHSMQTTPTYVHCNNPVIKDLYKRHGKDLCFAGVILTEGHWKTTFLKERSASFAAKIARLLDIDGVILTQEGAGMSMIDQMLACRECEKQGIKSVVITYEIGGIEGSDVPLLDSVPEADAIVSTGNREELLDLPAVETLLGGKTIEGAYVLNEQTEASGAITVNYTIIYTSTNQAGFMKMRSMQF